MSMNADDGEELGSDAVPLAADAGVSNDIDSVSRL
jgi:hypothetical protein